jgi:hypothetical protein
MKAPPTKGSDPPHAVLAKYLSITYTKAIVASAQQTYAEVKFRRIGFGQYGLIFENNQGQVIKVARGRFEDALWTDLGCHTRVYEAMDLYPTTGCLTPRVYRFISRDNGWWKTPEMEEFAAANKTSAFPMPAPALITQRILPLPQIVRDALIELFCPLEFLVSATDNPMNRDCLVRLYLGKRREEGPPSVNFSLRNFSLHLDEMIRLKLNIHDYAYAIATTLATIHWAARVDGYGIEFVLGGNGALSTAARSTSPSTKKSLTPSITTRSSVSSRDIEALEPQSDIADVMEGITKRPTFVNFHTTRLWVFDFALCTAWHPSEVPGGAWIDQLVVSFFENDPYYPLPANNGDIEETLWVTFAAAYLARAAKIVEGTAARDLPLEFITACVQRIESSQ